MRRTTAIGLSFVVGLLVLVAGCKPVAEPISAVRDAETAAGADQGFYQSGYDMNLTGAEKVGRAIWYMATGSNYRYHTYTLFQRMGVHMDWYRAMSTSRRGTRFNDWGFINDPDCCTPGTAECAQKGIEIPSGVETYGVDYCRGDAQNVYPFIGREGYRDPACNVSQLSGDAAKPSDCDLAFGASSGALGFRKFPNPRFDKDVWAAIGGTEGYMKREQGTGGWARVMDGAVEPPFLFGEACGGCHISLDPTNPPADPNKPGWENIKGAVGNAFHRNTELKASAMKSDSVEWQAFTHVRPGAVDTSAFPHDFVHNPGTMNAIINFDRRPGLVGDGSPRRTHIHDVTAGETTPGCLTGTETACEIPHILKGGEDSVGAAGAVQRVYVNIGMCAEQCWLNNLVDLRQIDPSSRNFRQTPFDVKQCRRDCPAWRAIENRVGDVISFLITRRPTDLKDNERGAQEIARYDEPTMERGAEVFRENCARCHSTQEVSASTDFLAQSRRPVGPRRERPRIDWLGNDELTPVTEVGTNRCRALHSNHLDGHIWEEFGSDTLRGKRAIPSDEINGDIATEGRGYYRNISLLSLWAHAPFMHNNGIGPELCHTPGPGFHRDFFKSPYVDDSGRPLSNGPRCITHDGSVEKRLEFYYKSMEALLTPSDERPRKVAHTSEDIVVPAGPRVWVGGSINREIGLELVIPKYFPVSLLVSFDFKAMVTDLMGLEAGNIPERRRRYAQQHLDSLRGAIQSANGERITMSREELEKLTIAYSNCTDLQENKGHDFGTNLSAEDKKALTAYMLQF